VTAFGGECVPSELQLLLEGMVLFVMDLVKEQVGRKGKQ
jgi:F0F1-type ATP synthase membrane subunit a